MRRVINVAGVLLAFLTAPPAAYGQAGNHWTEQYGNRSMLLSGAVIGSVSDLGLVFYNPGRLGLIEEPAFVLTAKGYQWDDIRLENALGEGVDLKDSGFGGAPTLAAGAFTVPFLEGHRFAYAFLTRRRDDNDFFLRFDRSGDLFDQFPGDDYFSGTVELSNSLKEDWIGLTWAPVIGGRWSLGLSTFYYHLTRKSHLALDMRGLIETDEVIVNAQDRTFKFSDHGLIWKAGLAGVFHPVSVGITVTSPRVSILASGRVQYEDLRAGFGTDNDEMPDDLLVNDVQRNLPAVTRSPWAVGAGVGVEWGRAVIHLAGEWYSAVPKYTVAEAEPFEGQSTGEVIEYRIVEELKSVVNGAVGIEWHRGERWSLFGSFATNGSATPAERSSFLELLDEVSTTTIRADFLQGGGGFVVSTSYFDLTLGANYSWASDRLNALLNLPDEGDDPVFGGDNNARFVASRWRFLFGFSFPFGDQLLDRAKGDTGGNGSG
jgi:hypothetical protein